MQDYNTQHLTMFKYWCQKVLPAVYDDSLSYYELLCKVVKYLNDVIAELNVHNDAITELQELYSALVDEFDEFKESGFLDYYEQQIREWVDRNLPRIFEDFLKIAVFFGLTLDGYFVAYIPKTWEEITFDTGSVYGNDEYGRLILQYYVDSPHEVEQ